MRIPVVAFVIVHVTCQLVRAQQAAVSQETLIPSSASHSLVNTAKNADVLVLGELHGTQEIPALVATILAPLTELGYRTLALEIPSDQQAALTGWATGRITTPPEFFSTPNGDGIGNLEVLDLIRTALSSRYQWRLICFDEAERDFQNQLKQIQKAPPNSNGRGTAISPSAIVDLCRQRDAYMAQRLCLEAQPLKSRGKVLVICGNLHARTANPATITDPFLTKLWPSFGALLKRDLATARVVAVNVTFHSGSYFNQGHVNKLVPPPPDKATDGIVRTSAWDIDLRLPLATAATFLSVSDTLPHNTKGRKSQNRPADSRPIVRTGQKEPESSSVHQ